MTRQIKSEFIDIFCSKIHRLLDETPCAGTLVQNEYGAWEPALKTDVSQHRCRVISKSPCWNLPCDDDVWLHEQATLNRAQNRLLDEQLVQIHKKIQSRRFFLLFRGPQDLVAATRVNVLHDRKKPGSV